MVEDYGDIASTHVINDVSEPRILILGLIGGSSRQDSGLWIYSTADGAQGVTYGVMQLSLTTGSKDHMYD